MTINWNPFAAPDSLPTYSPTEPMSYTDFDRAYLGDVYSTQTDYKIDDWVVSDSFQDQPVSSIELPETPTSANMPSAFAPKNNSIFGTNARNSIRSSNIAAVNPFGTISPTAYATQLPSFSEYPYTNGLSFSNPRNDEFEYSSRDRASPTPSLCGDSCQLEELERSQSEEASRRPSIKRASPEDISDEEPAPKRMPKKRGRPRSDRANSDVSSTSSSSSSQGKPRPSRRLPHNQVERKYREGLNAELERLRRAVPTLPQRDSGDLTGPPKPSKATVLASAIDYIKTIEAERERLIEENERLRGLRGIRAGVTPHKLINTQKLRSSYGWKQNRSGSTSSMSAMAS